MKLFVGYFAILSLTLLAHSSAQALVDFDALLSRDYPKIQVSWEKIELECTGDIDPDPCYHQEVCFDPNTGLVYPVNYPTHETEECQWKQLEPYMSM